MKNNVFKDIDKSILKRLSEEGADFLNSFLENEGYDLNDINSISEKAYKKQSFLLRGKLAYNKDQKLLVKASKLLLESVKKEIEKPVAFLKKLVEENELGVQYRNLDQLSIDQIKNIIKDQNLLEIIEMLDKEDESKRSE